MTFNSTWTQFQGGDGSNAGYIAINTAPLIQPSHQASVHNPGGSSPVVDSTDGSVYLAGGNGTLYHLNRPSGHEKRSHLPSEFSSWIGTTAALDEIGHVYAIYSESNTHPSRSILACFHRDGGFMWKYEPPSQLSDGTRSPEHPAYIFGVPKVWSRGNRTVVFIQFCFFSDTWPTRVNYLLGLDEGGIPQGLARFDSLDINLVGGGGLREIPGVRRPPARVETLPLDGPRAEITPAPLSSNFRMPEPSPCLFQDEQGVNFPIVVVTDGFSRIDAFRWIDPGFLPVWQHFSAEEYSSLPFGFSTPAILPNSILAVGGFSGHLYLLDPATGESFPSQADVGASITATPSSIIRQIYTVNRKGGVHMIDSNGLIVKSVGTSGESVSSPLVTGNHVYVANSLGIVTFDLALEQVSEFLVNAEGMGVASLAVAPNGTIYACSSTELFTFS